MVTVEDSKPQIFMGSNRYHRSQQNFLVKENNELFYVFIVAIKWQDKGLSFGNILSVLIKIANTFIIGKDLRVF